MSSEGTGGVNPVDIAAKPPRYVTLDAWRGIACLWVVLYHAQNPFVYLPGNFLHNGLHRLACSGEIGVWMFFVISGYCIASVGSTTVSRGKPVLGYLWSRMRRIYPPAWAGMLVYFVATATMQLLLSHGAIASSQRAAENVLYRPPIYYVANVLLGEKFLHTDYIASNHWTLCYEMVFYIIVGAFMLVALRRGGEHGMLNGLHCLTCLCLILWVAMPGASFYPLDGWPFFGCGILAYDAIRWKRLWRPRVWSVMVGCLVLAYACLGPSNSKWYVDGDDRVYLAFAFSFALALIVLHRFDERLSRFRVMRWAGFVGVISYSMYLIHYIPMSASWKVMTAAGLGGNLYVLRTVVQIAVAVLSGWVFFLLVERRCLSANAKARAKRAEAVLRHVEVASS